MVKTVFSFDPHQLRAARDHIVARFPIANTEPPGLDMLFEMLEGMDLAQAEEWAKSLGDREKDLLCRYFTHCRRSRAIMVLTVILGLLNDPRCSQCARWFFMLLPSNSLWEELKPYWLQNRIQELVATEAPWVTYFLEKQPLQDQLEFVMDELSRGALELEQLDVGFAGDSPLFMALLNYLFQNVSPASRSSR